MTELSNDKPITRQITIKAFDPALEDKTFVIEMSADGMVVRRLGGRDADYWLSWKSVISHALLHETRKK